MSESRKWWSNVKSLVNPTAAADNIHAVHIEDNWLTPAEFVESLNKYYTTNSDATQLEFPRLEGNPSTPCRITHKQIIKQLKALNTHKATHSEDFPIWISKHNAEAIAIPLYDIITTMMRTGKYPSLWKQSEISPLEKIASPSLFKDFRPISLLHHCGKVAESFIIEALISDNAHEIDQSQYAYTKDVGTVDALVDAIMSWKLALDDKTCLAVHALYEDFSKAFDNMRPDKLAAIMMSQGYQHGVIKLCVNYLTERRQRVIHKSSRTTSHERVNSVGVPQGTRCGPVLWNIFIKSLHTSEKMIKYADDLTIYITLAKSDSTSTGRGNKCTESQRINDAATETFNWCTNNCMTLNTSKTKHMVISLRDTVNLVNPVMINNDTIERVETFKLLGVHIDEHLNFHHHVNNIVERSHTIIHYAC